MDGMDIAAEILKHADDIERTKRNQALTADEAKTLQAADFLRRIMGIPAQEPPKQP